MCYYIIYVRCNVCSSDKKTFKHTTALSLFSSSILPSTTTITGDRRPATGRRQLQAAAPEEEKEILEDLWMKMTKKMGLEEVRRNLDQAKTILEALIKREEKKRELVESEITLQRIQMKYKHETELLEDSLAIPGLPSFPSKVGSSEEEFFDSDDVANSRPPTRSPVVQNPPFTEPKLVMVPTGNMRREVGRRAPHVRLPKLDPNEPVMAFTKPLHPDKLAAAGIMPPSDVSTTNSASARPLNFRGGRIGRGGRVVFDRWNPLMHTPIDCRHSAHH